MNDTGTAAARRFSERLDELRVRAAWAIVWLYSWMLYPYW